MKYSFVLIFLVACGNPQAEPTKSDSTGYYQAKIQYYDSLHRITRAASDTDNARFERAAAKNDRVAALKHHDLFVRDAIDAKRYNDSLLLYMQKSTLQR